jgi:hypothetical protein
VTFEPLWDPDDPTNTAPPWDQSGVESDDLPDSGGELLDLLTKQMFCDDWRLDWADRRVTWWAADTPLALSASTPGLVYGDPTVKLTFEIPVVNDVTASDEDCERVAAGLNRRASGRGVVYDPRAKRLSVFVTFYAHDGNRGVVTTGIPATLAVMAYAEALELTDEDNLVDRLGGKSPAATAGDRRGIDLDQLLELTDQIVIPAGLDVSRWTLADFEAAHAWLTDQGWLSLAADEQGTTVEFPFGENDEMYPRVVAAVANADTEPEAMESFLSFRAMVGADDDMATSLFTMRRHQHDILGSGLLMRLQLPVSFSAPATAANLLNLRELTEFTSFPAWGGWTVGDDSPTIQWDSFFPNMTHRPGYVGALAMHAMVRNFWVRDWYLREGRQL